MNETQEGENDNIATDGIDIRDWSCESKNNSKIVFRYALLSKAIVL